MLQFISILVFAGATFVLVSIRKRQVIRNCVRLSFLLLLATVILWLTGQFYIENGVDFHGRGKSYCEIYCCGSKVEISVTRYDITPLMVERFGSGGGSGRGIDFSPPDTANYFFMEVANNPDYEDPPRLFERFDKEFWDWQQYYGLSTSMDAPPTRYCYTSIGIPYWFIALLFAIFPLIYRLRPPGAKW